MSSLALTASDTWVLARRNLKRIQIGRAHV